MKFSIFALAIFMLLLVPSHAAETYEVTGVSANDVLNIRSRPSASAPKTGSYGPRESGIQVYRRQGNWALVGRADPSQPDGWVNARYLKLTVASRRVPLPLQCLGTEPFWSVTIDTQRMATYTDPLPTNRRYRVSNFRRVGRDARLRLGGSGVSFITARECSDGMSDNMYPYSARMRLPDGRVLDGCCRQR